MRSRNLLGLILVFSVTISHAQDNKFIPLDMTQKSYSFSLPELHIDSVFIVQLETILFDKNVRLINSRISNPNNRWRHFHLYFEKKDSLSYYIVASLWDIPARNSEGFFEHNGYLYWVGGETPPNIFLKLKSKKRFSYKEPIPAPYDPPFWYLIYNIETNIIEVKDS